MWKGLNRRRWLYFYNLKQLTVEGGGFVNGMGGEWWARSCKRNSTYVMLATLRSVISYFSFKKLF